MKKALFIIIPVCIIIMTLLLIKFFQPELFYLNEKYYNNDNTLIKINNTELKTLEEDKASFGVFVYQPLCAASSNFQKIISEFLSTYKISFYQIPFSNLDETKMDQCVEYYPTVVIYHEGKIVAQLKADKDQDLAYYESVEGFKKWLEKYIFLVIEN